MQSTPTPPTPPRAPHQRKPLVFFSCHCKVSELMQLAQQLQQMQDDARGEPAAPPAALAHSLAA